MCLPVWELVEGVIAGGEGKTDVGDGAGEGGFGGGTFGTEEAVHVVYGVEGGKYKQRVLGSRGGGRGQEVIALVPLK